MVNTEAHSFKSTFLRRLPAAGTDLGPTLQLFLHVLTASSTTFGIAREKADNQARFSSRMSERASPETSTYTSDGRTTPANEPPEGPGSVPKESKRRSPEIEQQAQDFFSQHRQPDSRQEAESNQSWDWIRGEASRQTQVNDGYRALFDQTFKEAPASERRDSELLPPSKIGASYWTSVEKEDFFLALARCGHDDVPTLSKAVATKSEPEVKLYISLLRQAADEANANLPPNADFAPQNTPAACEIGQECEDALDVAAEALAERAESDDVDLEKQRYRNLWLIDEDTAAEMERSLEQERNSPAALGGSGIDEAVKVVSGEGLGDDEPPKSDKTSERQEGEATRFHSVEKAPHSVVKSSFPSTQLLRPEMFLELSRNLFMNAPSETGNNWRTIGRLSRTSSDPAIFHSAFDDFNTLARHRTRKLVQASLFQTMSRLRGKDDQNPVEVVTEKDVRAAADLIGMHVNRKKFWATVAGRCRVDVYSDSKKWRNGRKGTRDGVKLSWEEVQAELGFPRQSLAQRTTGKMPGVGTQSPELASEKECDDGLDGETYTSDGGVRESGGGSGSLTVMGLRDPRSTQSDDEYDEDEEDDLESIDRKASKVEETALFAMLGRVPPLNEGMKVVVEPTRAKRCAPAKSFRSKKRMRYEAGGEQSSRRGSRDTASKDDRSMSGIERSDGPVGQQGDGFTDSDVSEDDGRNSPLDGDTDDEDDETTSDEVMTDDDK